MSNRFKLKGLSFDPSDLLAIHIWAERNELRMVVRLDHGLDDEEYEEVIALHAGAEVCLMLLWRDENVLFAQPLPGRAWRFSSVAEALSRLSVRHSALVVQ
jgi:hypothetical protein